MFLITWSREVVDRVTEALIRASELLEQRALEIESRHDRAYVRAVQEMRDKSRLAAKDATDLATLMREGERHVIRALCAECRQSLNVIASQGTILEIAPHECALAN